MASIAFFSEGIDFKLASPQKTKSWLTTVIKKEKRKVSSLVCIFCSDKFLSELNVRYLKHSTLTDIITFDYSADSKVLAGELYISIDRVRENAATYRTPFDIELHRVIVHGILHLLGYNDKTKAEIAQIRKKEEAYLSLRK